MTAPEIAEVCADLAAEQQALDAVVALLDDDAWDLLTPAEGWMVRDQVAHLAHGEDLAARAATAPEAFYAELGRVAADPAAYLAAALEQGRRLASPDLLTWWREARNRTLAVVAGLDPGARLPWVGPPMKPRSFLTARLMETFAHGVDVREALGIATEPTARLRHVAHLGVITRGFSYANRGLPVPREEVRVELAGPGGRVWAWGPPEAPDRVSGPILDFCLVVTQRKNAVDTALEASGEAAVGWLRIAQAFGGPPTDNRPPRNGGGSVSRLRPR